MQSILDKITEWLQGLLIEGIISNLSGMFDHVNTQVGEIAGQPYYRIATTYEPTGIVRERPLRRVFLCLQTGGDNVMDPEIQQEATQIQQTEQPEAMRQEIPEPPRTPAVSEQSYSPQPEASAQTGSGRRHHKQKRPSGRTALREQQPTAPPYRLQFTDEERADPELAPHIRKAEKAADKLEAAQAKIPKKKALRKKRTFDEPTGKAKVRLRFEETDKPKPPPKLRYSPLALPVRELAAQAHRQIHQVEKENVGVEAAHKSEEAAETMAGRSVRKAQSAYHSHKLKPYRTAARLERQADKAGINALYQKTLRNNPQLTSNPLSRWQQKQAVKRRYAAAKAGKGSKLTQKTAENTKRAAKKAAEAAGKTAAFMVRHPKGLLVALAVALLAVLLLNVLSSCSVLLEGGLQAIIGTSYTAEDEDILAAETYYTGLENQLRQKIGAIERTYPGYDEYRYSLAEIGHNPFELISYLTALYRDFAFAEVQSALDALFDRQYTLTVKEEIEVRYRTETHTDSEGKVDGFNYWLKSI